MWWAETWLRCGGIVIPCIVGVVVKRVRVHGVVALGIRPVRVCDGFVEKVPVEVHLYLRLGSGGSVIHPSGVPAVGDYF